MSCARPLRRAVVAIAAAWACTAVHAQDDEAAAAARLPQRVALLERAQSELERGDATQALDDFERAAMMLHASDAELGLIRAAMQDGQYRRALAFCAHTAGEHTDTADGAALYAWLLRIGGQVAQSRQVLADARARAPGDALLDAVATAFDADEPVASGVLLAPLHRMAPWPVPVDAPSPPRATARVAGNAVLVDDGTAALVPLAMPGLGAGARVWVRNGLGQTRAATPDRTDAVLEAHGLVRLRLQSGLPVGASREAVGRAPFAGSPGYSVQFGDGNQPAWPMLAQGFLGNPVGDGDLRKLGFGAPPGAPVLDSQGALIGITVGSLGGQATWLPAASWVPARTSEVGAVGTAASHAGLALVAPDEIYEAGLRRTLQVLVDGPR